MRVNVARLAPPSRAVQAGLAPERAIGRIAVQSLYWELVLYPKPGLVSLRDGGAHEDMDATTFLRSLFSLRHYFIAIAQAGATGVPMSELRRLGLNAETQMLRATGGVNTHRGAIFTLGLLSAAAGRAWICGGDASDAALRDVLLRDWHRDLIAVHASVATVPSHGQQVAARYRVAGARGEAVHAFPSVFEIGLPAMRDALARGAGMHRARLHAFFALAAEVDDTNVLFRGGATALDRVQKGAAEFIASGSVFADGWHDRAEMLHRECSRARVSPGGCADLLAAACFVHEWQALTR